MQRLGLAIGVKGTCNNIDDFTEILLQTSVVRRFVGNEFLQRSSWVIDVLRTSIVYTT